MTRSLNVDLGELTLTDIEDFSWAQSILSNQAAQTDWPFSSGERRSNLDLLRNYRFRADKTEPSENDLLTELSRLGRIGESLKFDLYSLAEDGATKVWDMQDIVFIDNVNPSPFGEETKKIDVSLQSSYRRIIDLCDALEDVPRGSEWLVDNGGGGLNVDLLHKKHGIGSVQLCGLINAATESRLRLNPPTYLDASWCKFFGFQYRTSNLTDLTELRIRVYQDAANYVSYDFRAEITDINKWFFIRIPFTDFVETGYFDWTDCRYFVWCEEHSSIQDYCYNVDEVCVIE